MTFPFDGLYSSTTMCEFYSGKIDFRPASFHIRKLFTLHDIIDVKPSAGDKEILNLFGIHVDRFLMNGAYSKAPIYVARYEGVRVVVKAQKINDGKISKHIVSEIDVIKDIRHPNIVYHFAYFKAADRLYNVMEYLPNGTLGRYIRSKSGTTLSELRSIFYQILQAVKYLHSNLISHRDIKDENIVMKLGHDGRDPIAKLCDFGFAIRLKSQNEVCTNYCGTKSFKSPELLHAETPYSPLRADVWALGILLYKMIVKTPPVYCVEKRKLKIDYLCLPRQVGSVVSKMLQICPYDRSRVSAILKSGWFRSHHENVCET